MIQWLLRRFRRRVTHEPWAPEAAATIRRLESPAELDACERVARNSGGEPFGVDDLRLWIADGGVVLVAVVDGEIVGCCCYVPMSRSIALLRLAVATEHQLRGIGRRLLVTAALHNPAEFRPLHAVVCETDTAVAFFERCGFSVVGFSLDHCQRARDNRPDELRDAWIMRLQARAFAALCRSAIATVGCDSPVPANPSVRCPR